MTRFSARIAVVAGVVAFGTVPAFVKGQIGQEISCASQDFAVQSEVLNRGGEFFVACCPNDCRTCGGEGCGGNEAGTDNCCIAPIEDSGRVCDEDVPPCILALPSTDFCSDGTSGVESSDGSVCCPLDCTQCGGIGCLDFGGNQCCQGSILSGAPQCDQGRVSAPCVLQEPPRCNNGLIGFQQDDVCCSPSCGTCGGPGCSELDGGASECCIKNIVDEGVFCVEEEDGEMIENGTPCIQGFTS